MVELMRNTVRMPTIAHSKHQFCQSCYCCVRLSKTAWEASKKDFNICLVLFEAGSHVAWAGLELTLELRVTSNSWSFCLSQFWDYRHAPSCPTPKAFLNLKIKNKWQARNINSTYSSLGGSISSLKSIFIYNSKISKHCYRTISKGYEEQVWQKKKYRNKGMADKPAVCWEQDEQLEGERCHTPLAELVKTCLWGSVSHIRIPNNGCWHHSRPKTTRWKELSNMSRKRY